ncbi:protein SUPPRESSOR OF npr1-1, CONSTITUTIVE 1-like isoform X2 [Rhodamnia argentea]|uniref:Protein SUPPRESSOR OF npr1-1, CONSTITUTIVE 1-like isoform X2 n=1 Tax=Rhodamnia argentea TaxID=178133 RepID=A0ABM3HXD4_9MYRT|nr:protein SUPPRESSOR OF npr1-1, CONSTITUTIVE 1-like isoform X2 [Rhodamnia argentea]
MASSDAPSGCEYQVFLSFRGPDTRTGFTDVLFHSLTSAGIRVFRDDEELRVGERIDGSLWRAIDNSRIYIPIFSRTYASSQWCLRELTQIVVNTFKSEGTKEILPIFFDVNPDDVKLKTPLYRDAVLNLEHEKKLSPEQVNAWREALMEVDAIKGWEVKKYKGHGELINLVVEEVVKKLKTKHRSVTEHLVGIDDRVVAVSKLLDVNSGGVRLVQIYGMGGIGKTTLAKKKKNVQTLDIDLRRSRVKDIKSEEIGRFENLRCLKLNGGTFVGNLAVCLTKLRWIFWSHPPRMSNSTNVHFKNVVVLRISYHDFMDDSKLQSLIETAIKLKVLSVESCPRITKTPKFSGYLNLERLTFTNCSNLRRIDDSIGKLKCLIKLKIDMCNHLEDLPEELGDLVNLEHFFVKGLEVKKLPDSIWKLKSLRKLRFFGIKNFYLTSFWELPSAIRMLQNLEVLIINTSNLGGQLPSEIGSLPSLKILDLSFTSVSGVPKTVGMLPRLQRLELRLCNEIQELPALPTSLTHLLASSISLRVVPDLSNLANLVELNLNEEGGRGCCTGELRGFGRLSKLTKLSLGLCNVPATELASLHLLKELHLFGLDQETFPQLPLSLQKLSLNNFNSAASIFPNLRDLLSLELYNCPMQEFQLDGLQLPHLRDFTVQCCGRLKRFRLSNMTKLTCFAVRACPKLAEIQFSWPFELLEHLCLSGCESLERLVYVGEAADDDDESVKEMITCEGRLVLASEALRKLRVFELAACHKILEIHVVGTSESWEVFHVWNHPLLQGIRGLPNLKNLRSLSAHFCAGLEVVEGLDELEFLNLLSVRGCQSLERLIDKSTTRLPNDCHLDISGCEKLREARRGFEGSVTYFKHHKEQQQELKPSRGVSLQPVQEQEQELESHLHQEQEREQELEPSGRVTSQPEQEQEQESHLHEEQEREEEQESHLKQEQQQESHSKQEQEQELKQRRRPGGVSFKCPSFTSSSLCCFHDGNRRGPSFKEVRGRSPSSHKEDG